MVRNKPDNTLRRVGEEVGGDATVSRQPRQNGSVRWTLHAVLHGRMSSGSDEPASLIMMELQMSEPNARKIQFEMRFKAMDPNEPDPEVVDLMPSGRLQPARGSREGGGLSVEGGGPSPVQSASGEGQISGFSSSEVGRSDAMNIAFWRTDGNAILRVVRPAVLVRRSSDRPFQALCRVNADVSYEKTLIVRLAGGAEHPVVFNPEVEASLPQWPATSGNLQEVMKEVKRAGQDSAAVLLRLDEESRRCLLSLWTPEQQLSYMHTAHGASAPGNWGWILGEAAYRNWLSSNRDDHSRVLWLHGPPGIDRARIAVSIVQELRGRLSTIAGGERQGGVVASYFFAPRANLGNRLTMVLRSLIHQILLQKPLLTRYLLEAYRRPGVGEKLFSDQSLLCEILGRTMQDPHIDVAYFVISGLELCDEEFLELFNYSKPRSSPTAPRLPRSRGKWILISREDPTIEKVLSMFAQIDLDTNSAYHVQEAVRAGVERLGLDDASQDSLRAVLADKANGSYLWLEFAVEAIRRDSERDIKAIQNSLQSLPKGLAPILDRILHLLLQVSDDTAKHITKTILPLVTIACGPLSFQTLEVISDSFRSLEIPQSEIPDKINDSCGSFVAILEDNLYIVHQSVKDFLKTPTAIAQLGCGSLQDLHKHVATQCLGYICQTMPGKTSTEILEYPAAFWMEHGRQSSQTSEELEQLLERGSFFATDSEARERWLLIYWRHRYGVGTTPPTNLTLLHLAAESGYVQLADVLLKRRYAPDVNAVDGLEKTPLHWAALYGHCDVARVLLGAGANMHVRAGDQTSVLQVAIDNGHKAMVQLLLSKGVGFEMEILREARTDIKQLLLEHVPLARVPTLADTPVGRRFWGAIAYIGRSSAYYHSKPLTLDRILDPDTSLDEVMADERPDNVRLDERPLRWIHLPENNMRWIEILMGKILKSPEAVASLLRSDLWRKRVRNTEKSMHARCIRPVYADFSRDITIGAGGDRGDSQRTMLVIPYLHWGTNLERLKLKNTIHRVQNGDNSLPGVEPMIYGPESRHQQLLKTYLGGDYPLHLRRTLDQFYYPGLDDEDMEFRDTHQTVSEHYRATTGSGIRGEETAGKPKDFPVLMVDQLWLWILGDDTVVTSFPHRWVNSDSFDPYHMTEIVAAVERRLLMQDWPAAVDSNKILAELIANECSGILFDISKYRDRWLQVREIYDSAISDVANRESALFRTFSSSLEAPRTGKQKDAEKERYAIGEEVALLKKIKDIRDELNMIRTIFQTQKMVLDGSTEFRVFQGMVDKRIKEVDNLDQHASQAHEALKHILDLKQKQANAEEAHFLSVQNIESSKQGQAIMTFTIVTIIFAPLSFLTSFFALQIVEFPPLTLGFVLEILFPITVFVVVICVSLAFFSVLKEFWQTHRGIKRAKVDSENAVKI